jgi:uncharacterized membrane protein
LRSFTSNRTAQNILGLLIGSFLYSLLVLVTVIDTSNTTFVPLLSTLIAIGFALIGIGAFIYFIDHIAKSIRVSYIIHTINAETIALLRTAQAEQVVGHTDDVPLSAPVMNREYAAKVNARHAGYIQAIDSKNLAALAEEHGHTVQIIGMTGDFIAKGRPLLYVWKQQRLHKDSTDKRADEGGKNEGQRSHEKMAESKQDSDESPIEIPEPLMDNFLQQFDIGIERTMYEDVLFGIRQLVDIALKALSPGVNDPTTAINCLHYLSNILIQATKRPDRQLSHFDEAGNLCLIGRTVSFSAMLDLTFDQLRHYGCTDTTVADQLLRVLAEVAEEVTEEDRRNLLWQHVMLIRHEVEQGIRQKYERDHINNRLRQLAKLLDQPYTSIALSEQ